MIFEIQLFHEESSCSSSTLLNSLLLRFASLRYAAYYSVPQNNATELENKSNQNVYKLLCF